MSTTATRHVKSSNSANILMCKQWWKVCWLYGDQEKYYRQLYGKRKTNNCDPSFFSIGLPDHHSGTQITELTDDFFQDNATEQIEPAPDESFAAETDSALDAEPLYGFAPAWQKDQRRQPIQDYNKYINATGLDNILEGAFESDNINNILESNISSRFNPKLQLVDSGEQFHIKDDTFGKTTKTVCRTKKGALVTEQTDISTDGRTTASLKFQRSTVKTGPNRAKEILQTLKEDRVLDECLRRKCIGDRLTTTTTTLVTVTQTSSSTCNDDPANNQEQTEQIMSRVIRQSLEQNVKQTSLYKPKAKSLLDKYKLML